MGDQVCQYISSVLYPKSGQMVVSMSLLQLYKKCKTQAKKHVGVFFIMDYYFVMSNLCCTLFVIHTSFDTWLVF